MSDTFAVLNAAAPASPMTNDTPEARSTSYGFSPSIVALVSEASPQADAIRALRTHIMARHFNLGRRSLAICAPSAGVGSSFIATNLAVGLSQIGVKTLLIDADLRRPAIERLIRPPGPRGGLVQALRSNDMAFAANIDPNVLPNFSIMYAGQAASNAQELLATERFQILMNYCLREFDATIVDTPAANMSSDARRISGVVGYSLIVAAKNMTFLKDITTLSEQLHADKAIVIGTVMNRA